MRNTTPNDGLSGDGGLARPPAKKPSHLPTKPRSPSDPIPKWADPESRAQNIIPGYSRRSQKRQLRRRKKSRRSAHVHLGVDLRIFDGQRTDIKQAPRSRRAHYVSDTVHCYPSLP